jgi:hypothetical protein
VGVSFPRDAAVPPADLLRQAHQIIAAEHGPDDWLADVAGHLIACAAEVVALLPKGDLEAAREALGSARAAVGVAIYTVRRLHDDARTA